MTRVEAARLGGLASGFIQRTAAIDLYAKTPIKCKECKGVIPIRLGQKVAEVRKKQFCNQSCNARFHSRKRKKPRQQVFLPFQRRVSRVLSLTKGELFSRREGYQSARSAIQRDARARFFRLFPHPECKVCGYDKHVEIAHIKAVASFPPTATVDLINSLDNLIALCPNHHWEHDNGLL